MEVSASASRKILQRLQAAVKRSAGDVTLFHFLANGQPSCIQVCNHLFIFHRVPLRKIMPDWLLATKKV